MREMQMAKLRDPFSQELAYHARCFLVQWKEALKGLHSVLVLAHINEEKVSQAVEEAQAISACNDFQQRKPTLDDSIALLVAETDPNPERCSHPQCMAGGETPASASAPAVRRAGARAGYSGPALPPARLMRSRPALSSPPPPPSNPHPRPFSD